MSDPEHDALRDDLPLHLTGDLSPAEAARLEAHLVECAGCREERADLREARAGLEELCPAAVSAVDLTGFYAERLAPALAPTPRLPWVARAAAVLLAFVAGAAADRALHSRPAPAPDARRATTPTSTEERLQRASQAAASADDGLARGLLTLAALEQQ